MTETEEELRQAILDLARKFHERLGPKSVVESNDLPLDVRAMLDEHDDDEIRAYMEAPVTGAVLLIGRGELNGGSSFCTTWAPPFQDPFYTLGLIKHASES